MIDFTHVRQTVEALKAQLAQQQIDEKTFEDRLLTLIDVAEDGHYWMFGHESERWYRHNGETWLPGDPKNINTQQPKPDNPGPNPAFNPGPAPAEPLNWVWFFISLVLLSIVGGIVYNSSVF